MKTQLNWFLVAAIAFGMSVLTRESASAATSIAFNFIGGGESGSPGTIGALETAGAPGYVQGNWNNLDTDWSGNGGAVPGTIKDSAGNTVSFPGISGDPGAGPGIWYDSGAAWGNGGPNVTGDDHLMRGYLDDNGNGSTQPFIQLYNIPYAKYNVVVYFDGDGPVDGALGPYWVETATANPYAGGGTLLTPKVYAKGTATFNGTFTQVPLTATSAGTAVQGNYIVFEGLTASDINIRATRENDSRAPINGFQIVPEPSSLALATLGLAGLLGLRRRGRKS